MSYLPMYQLHLARKNAEIAYLKAVCRIAADKLRDVGTFPINGELWSMLDFAAGPETIRTAVASDGRMGNGEECGPAKASSTLAGPATERNPLDTRGDKT